MPGPGYYLIGEEEKKEVLEVLNTGHLSRYGSDEDPKFLHKVYSLEQEFAKRTGASHCVAVSSGTGALMACLTAVGIKPGDEVLVPGYTFVASFSSIIAIGAVPVMVEIDDSLTMDTSDARVKITPKTRAIMPVHMLGNPSNMDAITALAKEKGLFLIEDCCQALGASYKGKMLGTFGEMGAFSLNNFKVINSGDGGLLVTNDRSLYERAFGFHDQGHMPLRKGSEIGKRSLIGINMRMNELTGAFALAQLRKLDIILNSLRTKKARFKQNLQSAHLEGLQFRTINDPGECATLLTVILEDVVTAQKVAEALGTKTVDKSGWHVYNNMEQILAYKDRDGKKLYEKHMLPKTDDLVSRAVNLSIGVVDSGLGTDFGINILSTDSEIDRKAEQFIKLVKPIIG
jgi:dTDP-4-amino-4,6-dideoxygalactose transaminase